MAREKDKDSPLAIGCFIIVLIVFFGGLILEFLKELIGVLVIIGGIVAVGYLLFRYEQRTNGITNLIADFFALFKNKETKNQSDIYNEIERGLLDKGKEQGLLPDLGTNVGEIDDKYKELKKKNKKLKKALKKKKKESKDSSGKQVLDYLYSDEKSSYSKSTEFAKKEKNERLKKKEKELDDREFRQEVKEEIAEVKSNLAQHKNEVTEILLLAREDRDNMKIEYRESFAYLDSEIKNVKTYFESKLSTLENLIKKVHSDLDAKINNLSASVDSRFADIRLQFGEQILDLKKAQMRVVEILGNQRQMINEVKHKLREVDFRSKVSHYEAQFLNKKTAFLFEKAEQRSKVMNDRMNIYLDKIAVHDQKFALSAKEAALDLNQKRREIEFLCKDVGYRELGINALRKDYEQRHKNGQLELNNKANEIRMLKQQMESNWNNREKLLLYSTVCTRQKKTIVIKGAGQIYLCKNLG